MYHCIYHSRDLDGLTSGAIIYHNQISFGEDCVLTGYDYGQKLDTRIFKGKVTVMIDVSMDMERMELLGTNCMEFIWIDHHISAYNALEKYCEQKGHKMVKNQYNDHIERVEVNAMNLIYFYSNKLSGCEITSVLYGKNLGQSSRKLVSILGQYDTWRDTEEKKFVLDEDWQKVVLPVQYFMRTCSGPREVQAIFRQMNAWTDALELNQIIGIGSGVLQYQINQNKTNICKNFEFELYGLRIIALNTTNFNSMSFDGYYHPDIHDAMMPFMYDGKQKKWMFSLYATKNEVNILEIAQKFGGGGHAKACGFSVNPEYVNFSENCIEFGDMTDPEYKYAESPDQIPKLFTEKKPSRKGFFHREVDGKDYLVSNLMVNDFNTMLETDREAFDKKFGQYIVVKPQD